jgi:hypothetical protein
MTKTSKLIAGLTLVAGFGVAALPLASYADTTDTKTIDVTASVLDAASISNPTIDACGNGINVTPTTIGASVGTAKCDIYISTNDQSGYKLSIDSLAAGSGFDNTNSLISSSNSISALGSTYAYTAGDVAGGGSGFDLSSATNASAWGFNVKEGTAYALDASGFYAVPAAKTEVHTTSDASAHGYTLSFGATITATQAQGTYKDVITLTVEDN